MQEAAEMLLALKSTPRHVPLSCPPLLNNGKPAVPNFDLNKSGVTKECFAPLIVAAERINSPKRSRMSSALRKATKKPRRRAKSLGSSSYFEKTKMGYSPEERSRIVGLFIQKRKKRVWEKRTRYEVRKQFADKRMRVKGRFVSKEDESTVRAALMLVL